MATYANPNQFKVGQIVGAPTGRANNNVFFCTIDPASVSTIVGGSIVKLKAGAGPQTLVDLAAVTDTPLGVVAWNAKKNTYAAGDVVQVLCVGSHVFLETGAAVSRGARLKFTTSSIVTTHAATNAIIGKAWGQAAASGDVIEVEIAPEVSQ